LLNGLVKDTEINLMQRRYQYLVLTAGLSAFFLLSGFGIFGHKKYETPITKDTLQPDKVLFDRAIRDIEHGNYEVARITLNTLINTYDTSEFLAKAKLAIADSWYREGGSHGLAQAEAEYKDFILFYPNMEEAAESQYKVCDIHYRQMEKADRDPAQAQRAEDECRQMMVQFPNSKFLPKVQQMLRDTQEVLADKEYKTGDFYHHKGSFPAAANRMAYVAQQYPLYSGADEALFELADAYKHMGDRFENDEADALTRIVRDYPMSEHVPFAKDRLTAMKRAVPQADPAAYARMKYEGENLSKPGMVHRSMTVFASRPDTSLAAKTGAPAMQAIRPAAPVSVPKLATGGQTGVSDVVAGQVADTAAIDQKQDARLGTPALTAEATPGVTPQGTGEQKASVGSNGQPQIPGAPVANVAQQSLPTNHPLTSDQIKAYKKEQIRLFKLAKKNAAAAAKNPARPGTAPATTPAGTTPVAAPAGTAPADTAAKPAGSPQ
jgi:outer membrane protein assembly factor BamD